MARETGGPVYYAPDADQLAGLYGSITEQVTSEYKVIYLASSSGDEQRMLRIGINRRSQASDQRPYRADGEVGR